MSSAVVFTPLTRAMSLSSAAFNQLSEDHQTPTFTDASEEYARDVFPVRTDVAARTLLEFNVPSDDHDADAELVSTHPQVNHISSNAKTPTPASEHADTVSEQLEEMHISSSSGTAAESVDMTATVSHENDTSTRTQQTTDLPSHHEPDNSVAKDST